MFKSPLLAGISHARAATLTMRSFHTTAHVAMGRGMQGGGGRRGSGGNANKATSQYMADLIWQKLKKHLYLNTIHQHQTGAQEQLTKAMVGWPVSQGHHLTISPLSSAQLLCATVKNAVVRNRRSVNRDLIREIFDLMHVDSEIWQVSHDMSAMRHAYRRQWRYLTSQLEQLESMEPLMTLGTVPAELTLRKLALERERFQLEQVLKFPSKNKITINVHPSKLHRSSSRDKNDGKAPTVKAKHLVGIDMRMIGPGPGAKRMKMRHAVGITTNKNYEGMTETAHAYIPSIQGGFGLRISMFYAWKDTLTPATQRLNVQTSGTMPFLMKE